jgi:hypothetical protein
MSLDLKRRGADANPLFGIRRIRRRSVVALICRSLGEVVAT